jgi:hypothetical protein
LFKGKIEVVRDKRLVFWEDERPFFYLRNGRSAKVNFVLVRFFLL